MKAIMFTVLIGLALGAFAQTGRITDLTGTVELKPAGAAGFTAASVGGQVEPGTIVSTGFKSSAVIAVGSAVIAVRPLTRLSLEEIQVSQSEEKVRVNLQTGRLRIDVNPPSGALADFNVVTPTATASVRGTGFEMDTRNLAVNEGVVSFRGERGAATAVYAGSESAVIPGSGRVADPLAVTTSALIPPAPTGMDTLISEAGTAAPTATAGAGSGAAPTPAAPTPTGFGFGFQFNP